MFNDILSKDQCVELVRRLARCAFPFQCAHGRPSMVPIVDIGASSGNTSLGGLFKWEKDGEKPGDLLKGLKKLAGARRAGSE